VQRRGRKEESSQEVKYTPTRLLPLLFAIVVVIDQITKTVALSSLTEGRPVPVIGDLLRWTLTHNPGGAFGLRLGSSNYYLVASLIIFVVLVLYIWRHRDTAFLSIPLSIVAGGAIGNIIDRFRFGQVVDFIDCEFPDITIGTYHLERWPIFNVADMAVSLGITVTIILLFLHSRNAEAESPDVPTPTGVDKPE
jgi:signal peptidase II